MQFNAQSAEFPFTISNALVNNPQFSVLNDKVHIKVFPEKKGVGIILYNSLLRK